MPLFRVYVFPSDMVVVAELYLLKEVFGGGGDFDEEGMRGTIDDRRSVFQLLLLEY